MKTEIKAYLEIFYFCIVIAFFAGLVSYAFVFLLQMNSIYRVGIR